MGSSVECTQAPSANAAKRTNEPLGTATSLLYGSEVKQAVRRTHATRWNKEPWALGAFSAAAPGGQWARKALAEPLHNQLWFAGEAVHETLWGTVGGAWEAGERAADAALRRLSKA